MGARDADLSVGMRVNNVEIVCRVAKVLAVQICFTRIAHAAFIACDCLSVLHNGPLNY